jgi:hypothetical protein
LRQKCHVAVGRRVVVDQSGVSELARSERRGAFDERARFGAVPHLRTGDARQ